MYIRFIITKNDPNSGMRQGLFRALGDLKNKDLLKPHEQVKYDTIHKWFDKNLDKPDRFAKSRKTHAKLVALSWFKATAPEHILRMREIVEILKSHGIFVEMLKSNRPGYIVHEINFK
ncbi:MAG: hypothetical protein ACQ9MH_03165 [Nitrospinales bacterium]